LSGGRRWRGRHRRLRVDVQCGLLTIHARRVDVVRDRGRKRGGGHLVGSHGRWKRPRLRTTPEMRPGGAMTKSRVAYIPGWSTCAASLVPGWCSCQPPRAPSLTGAAAVSAWFTPIPRVRTRAAEGELGFHADGDEMQNHPVRQRGVAPPLKGPSGPAHSRVGPRRVYHPLREEGVEGGGTGLFSTSRTRCRQFLS
jgi:hypothetical protein